MRKFRKNRNWIAGILLLLLAAFIVVWQLGITIPLTVGSVVLTLIAVYLLGSGIGERSFTKIPFALALGYLVLRNLELVPFIATWAVLVTALLIGIALGILFPQRFRFHGKKRGRVITIESDQEVDTDESSDDNPYIDTRFGNVSRYLYSENLQTVTINSEFANTEIYFEQAKLRPEGATVYIRAKFGNVSLYVPKEWDVQVHVGSSFGQVDVEEVSEPIASDAPRLTIEGSNAFGNTQVNRV